jgi:hypothetical protein
MKAFLNLGICSWWLKVATMITTPELALFKDLDDVVTMITTPRLASLKNNENSIVDDKDSRLNAIDVVHNYDCHPGIGTIQTYVQTWIIHTMWTRIQTSPSSPQIYIAYSSLTQSCFCILRNISFLFNGFIYIH